MASIANRVGNRRVRYGATMRRALKLIAAAVIGLLIGTCAGVRGSAALRETRTPNELEAASYVEAAGLRLHYEERGAGGPTVLFVHGSMAWSATWRPMMDRVAASGRRAVALDLPPFGFSERPEEHDYTRGAQADRILAFVRARELAPVVLVGHSFGGGATVEAAMRGGDDVVGLVLLDAAIGLMDEEQGAPVPLSPLFSVGPVRNWVIAATFTNPQMIRPGLEMLIVDPAVATDARIAVYRRPVFLEGTTDAVGRWLVRGLYGDDAPAQSADVEAYGRYDTPTLLVWGREDQVTPLAQGEHLQRSFADAELVVLDDVNHIPHLEDLDGTSGALLRYLEALQAL